MNIFKNVVLEVRGYVDRIPRCRFCLTDQRASKSDVHGASYGRFTETGSEGYNNNTNNNKPSLVARGCAETQIPAILPRVIRDGRKGYPLHKCCGESTYKAYNTIQVI